MGITEPDTPSSPGDFASVTPHGRGPAPYDIQAPMADLSGVFADAGALSSGQENSIYGVGPRQVQTAALIQSPQGFGSDGYDVIDGWHGGAGDGWPNDVEPDVAGP